MFKSHKQNFNKSLQFERMHKTTIVVFPYNLRVSLVKSKYKGFNVQYIERKYMLKYICVKNKERK